MYLKPRPLRFEKNWRHSFSRQLLPCGLLLRIALSVHTPLAVARSDAHPQNDGNSFVGSQVCAGCHVEIAAAHKQSDHARTLRRVEELDELLQANSLKFHYKSNDVEYRIEKSSKPEYLLDLVAVKGQLTDRLHLSWGFGSGRRGVTFVGKTDRGGYGQSLVSWYQKLNALDITTGLDRSVSDATDALADGLTPAKRVECFSCHVTRAPETLPEVIDNSIAGIQCERCHGPGEAHVKAIRAGASQTGSKIGNLGSLRAREQIRFCGACHGEPPGESDLTALSEIIAHHTTVRFPPKRLVLSRCFDESDGRLKCTTCHDPHSVLPTSLSAFDVKCLACHSSKSGRFSACPVSRQDCVSCHMPREKLMMHSDFADHWIRKVRTP